MSKLKTIKKHEDKAVRGFNFCEVRNSRRLYAEGYTGEADYYFESNNLKKLKGMARKATASVRTAKVERLKYFDVYFEVYPDTHEGYSVFVMAFDEQDAVDIVRDECLYDDISDLNCLKAVSEISESEYLDAVG